MQNTKITISPEESEALGDTGFFRKKAAITSKIIMIFSELAESLRPIIADHPGLFPPGTSLFREKISRGENYKGLPYIVIDFPAMFGKESVFAFRSMLWWGKHFSFSFHLGGDLWKSRQVHVTEKIAALHNKGFYLCVNKTPWEYHFESDNYLLLDELQGNKTRGLLQESPFIKIARRLEVAEWQKVIEYGKETFSLVLDILPNEIRESA